MSRPSLVDAQASRFFNRWVHASSERTELVKSLEGLSLNPELFARLLQQDLTAGFTLPRAMRRLRNLIIVSLIQRDLAAKADLAEVLDTMTAFADFAVQSHLEALHKELCDLHGQPIGADSGKPQQMIVIGMGKLGGGELNVSSDIDLIFIYPEDGETHANSPDQRSLSNHEFFARLGKKLIADLSAVTEDGFTFRVDMALRPNGNSGPLAASFGMLEQYFVVQGREWERYAWVKARALTGDAEEIAALDKIVRPFVYRRYLDFSSIEAMRIMHAQIRAEVKRQEARHPGRSNNVKLGRGGIREVEFLAQVFQLIRGGRDPELRDRSTRKTLRIIADKGLHGADEVKQLLEAYTFLRNAEHRIQYLEDAQTHSLPSNDTDLLLVAQMMGYEDIPSFLEELDSHRGIVAAQFDAIFSDKKGEAQSEEENAEALIHATLAASDNEEAVQAHLQNLGYDDAATAANRLIATWKSPRMQHLPEASRNKLIGLVNTALPLIAAQEKSHGETLGRLLDFLATIARRASYLALLTEFPHALKRVIRMMAASDWAAQYLMRHPLLLDELLDDKSLHEAPDWPAFTQECRRVLEAASGDTERQMDALRELHHAQQFRLLAQDLEGELTVERLADHLSALADVLVSVTLETLWKALPNTHRENPRFAVIAYGKLGGKELGYASDLDLVFLYEDDDQNAPMLYSKLAQRFITWMTTHTPAGRLFDIDIALRPDGASGLMVPPIASFEKYQLQSAWIWEHQALTRARYCAGDAELGAKFEAIREKVLRQPRDEEKLRSDVLAMRKRLHDAHPNKSGLHDLKHDFGGMIDIEFMVQYLVLRHAPQYPELTPNIGNIALIKRCGELGLVNSALANQVADAYRNFRRMQHQIRLQGADRARVELERVKEEVQSVKALWREVFDGQEQM